ncbi:hypothetical protein [Actinomadura sp. WMMA1423]|uniref:hypothetical protein n=1 Tax=Actinomadura sp. WMMA1423 TaxID=2591108 RepID=UPI0011472AAC|nr:hypothetical protein [Actinomadura sp. WMMA1423]
MRTARRPLITLLGTTLTAISAVSAPAAASARVPNPTTPYKWGVVYRNTTGSPSATLRYGPYGRPTSSPSAQQPPPYGLGSLGIIVGSGTDKIEFGNESDFAGIRLADINILRYWINAGMDDLTGIAFPGITIEIDPKLNPAVTYSSLNYVPTASTSPSAPTPVRYVWQRYDATTSGSAWFATGSTGTTIGCTPVSPCSFADLKTKLPNAEITLSLGISKGRDTPFYGAVDSLRFNNLVYDFELNGVLTKAPLPTS